ncbi:MAG: FliM/FliN family flagellar motor switch protein [Pseudomonadota bacterium]
MTGPRRTKTTSRLLGRLPERAMGPEAIEALNGAAGRVGRLAVTVGPGTMTLVPTRSEALGLSDVVRWFSIRTSRGNLAVGLSAALANMPDGWPLDLAFETTFDLFLVALETSLGAAVEVNVLPGGQSYPHRRDFQVDWSGRSGLAAIAYDVDTASMVHGFLRQLPFAPPRARDFMTRPAVEIGRFDLSGDDFRDAVAGEILLPRPEDLSAETGRLVIGEWVYGRVDLSDCAAELRGTVDPSPVEKIDRDTLVFRLPCAPMQRSHLRWIAEGDVLALADSGPGHVDICRGGQPVGSGILVRLGDRLAVELRNLDLTRRRRRAAADRRPENLVENNVPLLTSSGSGKITQPFWARERLATDEPWNQGDMSQAALRTG